MARARAVFRCATCGSTSPRWAGRCPGCNEWNTLSEEIEVPVVRALSSARSRSGATSETPQPIGEVDVTEWAAKPTGVSELDRVLGGGLVPGSVTLLGGEPGIGKSTLVLQALGRLAGAAQPTRCLLVTAEESRAQVRSRGERLGALAPELWLLPETSLPVV